MTASLRGFYWRLTDAGTGRVAVALCGVCPGWALVGLAVHPGGWWRSRIVDDPHVDDRGVRVGTAFAADARHVRLDLGPGCRLEAEVIGADRWPRAWNGLGPGGWLPGLAQYWRPDPLRARVTGAVEAAERWSLHGWSGYAERNWGPAFPSRWWWGEAHDFGGDPVTVAFAGGPAFGPLEATAVVVRLDGRLVRLGEPVLAGVSASVEPGSWRLRGRSLRHGVEVEAAADPAAAHVLDVPLPDERRVEPWSHQHLAGGLRVRVTRRGRTVYAGQTDMAGLELGRGTGR